MNEPQKYWTFSVDGEIFDADFSSRGEALQSADYKFCEECGESEDYKFNQSRDIELILYRYDDELDRDILSTEKITLYYEYEPDEAPYLQSEFL